MATPATYVARLTVTPGNGEATVLEERFAVRRDGNVMLADADLTTLFELRRLLGEHLATMSMALRNADQIREQITQAQTAIKLLDELDSALAEAADSLKKDIDDIIRTLRGQPARSGQATQSVPDTVPAPSVQQRLRRAGGINSATALPTEQERDALESAGPDLQREVDRLNDLLVDRMPAFFRELDEAGVPWTPGRPIRTSASTGSP